MSGDEEKYRRAMNQGHSTAWDQLWEQAANYYRQALEEFPEDLQALTSLGMVLEQLRDFEEALACYTKAARVMPDDPLPLDKVGQISERLRAHDQAAKSSLKAAELYVQKGDIEKAIENLERVSRINPRSLVARSRLAMIYEKLKRKQSAVKEYLAIASLMQYNGDHSRAVRTLEHALTILPDDEEIHRALASLREGETLSQPPPAPEKTAPLRPTMEKQSQAVDKISTPQNQVDPISAAQEMALSILASLLFEYSEDESRGQTADQSPKGLQGVVGEALSSIFAQKGDQAKLIQHLSQALELQSNGEDARAADQFDRAISLGLDHPAVYFAMGLLRSRSEHLESALRYLGRAVNHPDFAMAAYLTRGDILRRMGRVVDASIEYLHALKLADADVVGENKRGDIEQLYQQLIDAQAGNQDIDSNKRLCDSVVDLLQRPNWRERLEEAREEIPMQDEAGMVIPLGQILVESKGGQVIDSIASIHKLVREGYLQTALEEAYFATQFAPRYLPLHIYIGDIFLELGRIPDAVAKFSMVADTYWSRDEIPKAIELLRRIIQLSAMDLNARRRLIDLLIASGQIGEAVQENLDLGDILYNQAEVGEARQCFTSAFVLAQKNGLDRSRLVEILYKIADIDTQSLNWREAVQGYQKIRSLDADDMKARARLVELALHQGRESQAIAELESSLSYLAERQGKGAALEFLKNLVLENPENNLLGRRLADEYIQAGKTSEAIQQLKRIGESMVRAGDQKGAAGVLEAILALDPSAGRELTQLLKKTR